MDASTKRIGSARPRGASIKALALLGALGMGCSAAPPPGSERMESESQPLAVTLQNGWTNAPFSTRNAAAWFDPGSGIVHLSGAVAGGTSSVVFTLPTGYWPGETTYVPVDLCGAANGRLIIGTNGVVSVQAQGAFSSAQCFTSLEGASFAPTSAGFSALTLQNGWTPYFSGQLALYGTLGGAVRFRGSIANGTTGLAFTLPAGFRPSTDVYVPVDLCGANNGRLYIQPNGNVTVQAENGTFSNAQCFTSLDGAWFVPSTTSSFTSLSLQNGWTNAPYSTAAAAVENVGGIVHFKGAIANGASATAFTLPGGLWPTTNVYVPVDLCGATKGRLQIAPNGVVNVQAENGTFSNAQCFTSLEGASYSIAGFDAPPPPFPIPFPQMPSHGGPTLPKLQLQSVSFANNPQGAASAAQFGGFIVGSQWLQQITAEYGPSPFPATNTNQTLPAPPAGMLDVGSLLLQSLQSHALTIPPDTSGLLYLFWVPAAYCDGTSFHGYETYNGTKVAFSELCGQTTPLSGSSSHEVAEVITDPYPPNTFPYPPSGYFFDANEGAWAQEGEVADACIGNWQEGQYTLWSVWSNKAAAAGGSPCFPFPGPSSATYINVSPSAPNVDWHVWNTAPLVVPAGGSVQVTLQGWSTPVYSGSWTLFTQTPSTNPYTLGTQLSTTTMTQNGTSTLTLSVPSSAVSGQLAYTTVGSVIFGPPGHGSGLWPFAVKVQ